MPAGVHWKKLKEIKGCFQKLKLVFHSSSQKRHIIPDSSTLLYDNYWLNTESLMVNGHPYRKISGMNSILLRITLLKNCQSNMTVRTNGILQITTKFLTFYILNDFIYFDNVIILFFWVCSVIKNERKFKKLKVSNKKHYWQVSKIDFVIRSFPWKGTWARQLSSKSKEPTQVFVSIVIVLKYKLIDGMTIQCHISDRTYILKIFFDI